MKKFIVTAFIASIVIIFMPKTVRADAALDLARNFNTIQANSLNATRTYYNLYQVPVYNTYQQAMSNQIAQALASNYQAQTMYQQALLRGNVNNFQLDMNYNTYLTNLNTQYINMMNNYYYAQRNNMDISYAQYVQMVNKIYANMLGQPLYPQAP